MTLIGVYLLSHGFLFLNFMTVNPKALLLVATALLAAALWWVNRREDPGGVGSDGAA